MTRRRFLGAAGALGGTAALAACGAGSGPAGRNAQFSAAYQGGGSSEIIEPGVVTMFIDEARVKHLYDGLFEVDSTMAPVPRLALDATPNGDGTRWRLTLREARWHDGTAFTGEDVLFTLARILGPQQGPLPFVAATTLSQIDLRHCRTLGDRQVEIALTSPSFEVPTLLASYGTQVVKAGTKDFTRPNGTGPYRFASFTPGREFTGTRYEQYWAGTPRTERLRIVSADTPARVSALRDGQVQFADDIDPTSARVLKGLSGLTVHETPDSGILYFAMKTDRPPFDNPDVRRAMMYLVDREALVKVALEGAGTVSDDVFGRGYRYYPDDLPPHRHDPDRARQLLRSAGVKDLAFDLFAAPVANGFVEAAHLFAQQAAGIGVRVNVRVGDSSTYYTQALAQGDMTMGQSGPLPLPYHFASRLLSNAPRNVTRWHDPAFDQLFRKAQTASSAALRTSYYHQMDAMLHDSGGYIFWATTPWITAYRSGYHDVPQGVPNSLDWARFEEVYR